MSEFRVEGWRSARCCTSCSCAVAAKRCALVASALVLRSLSRALFCRGWLPDVQAVPYASTIVLCANRRNVSGMHRASYARLESCSALQGNFKMTSSRTKAVVLAAGASLALLCVVTIGRNMPGSGQVSAVKISIIIEDEYHGPSQLWVVKKYNLHHRS